MSLLPKSKTFRKTKFFTQNSEWVNRATRLLQWASHIAIEFTPTQLFESLSRLSKIDLTLRRSQGSSFECNAVAASVHTWLNALTGSFLLILNIWNQYDYQHQLINIVLLFEGSFGEQRAALLCCVRIRKPTRMVGIVKFNLINIVQSLIFIYIIHIHTYMKGLHQMSKFFSSRPCRPGLFCWAWDGFSQLCMMTDE